jgi:Polyketide cyclase / dehydrase and lipid transport
MPAPIEAEVVVAADQGTVFDYLARLDNHWRLMDGSVEVLSLDGDGEDGPDRAVVRLHGPLGMRRTVHTRVLELEPPRVLRGRAGIGPRSNGGRVTEGEVTWTIDLLDEGGTRVHLSASVRSAAVGDRIVLALGGRAWMRTRFRAALARLGRLVA